MKIEIGESLCYSYLRHVKQCWLVQTNWKSSEHWAKRVSDGELDSMFQDMRRRFDLSGDVFKRTSSVGQFMQQGEIDVIGIDQESGIHAMDVAFHEAGLNYGGGVANRVLKKMLRAYILLAAYHPQGSTFHIYFVSPKVHRAVQGPLENTFAALQEEYPETGWHLITNQGFHEQIVLRTLEQADTVADTAELFVRASKLLNLSGNSHQVSQSYQMKQESPISVGRAGFARPANEVQLQDLVRGLMRTLLDDYPTLLNDADIRNLMDHRYCGTQLSLKIGNHALLREQQQGREISGRSRYWRDLYGGRFYVCSQWWKDHHLHNANSLLNFVDHLRRTNPDHPHISELVTHRQRLNEFLSVK